MINYMFKRLCYSAVALVLLMFLIFFIMQAIPGYSIDKSPTETIAEYHVRLENEGLLDNIFVQLWTFIKNIFVKGEFGRSYSEAKSVTEVMLEPIQFTIWIAIPAFILSSFVGIALGTIAAFNRGKAADVIINIVSVLFVSIPSFVLALYLLKLARHIGLPTQFYVPGSGYSMGQVVLSLIIPIISMSFSSISMVTYYTRNELVEVIEQDYIRTGLSKGYSSKRVILRYGIRNASIPIVTALLPSFLAIISGSIIIEKFFAVPGTSSKLVAAIQKKDTYIVMFSVVFFSALYFILQLALDVLYTILDPRITIASSNSVGISKKIKHFIIRKNKLLFNKQPKLNLNINHHSVPQSDHQHGKVNFLRYEKINVTNYINYESFDTSLNQASSFDNKVVNANKTKPILLQPTTPKFSASVFKPVNIFKRNNEEIIGKPTTYTKDIITRFFKSKTAVFFTIVFALIVILSITVSLSKWNTFNDSLTTSSGLPASLLSYMPPRIPWLGVSGIASEQLVDQDMYNVLKDYVEKHNVHNPHNPIELWTSAKKVGTQWMLYNYNPYAIETLSNMTILSGTDGLARDWWTLAWYSTAKSLTIALIVAFTATFAGSVYGSIAGYKAGSTFDILLMRFVDILDGIPLILLVIIFSTAVSQGVLTLTTLGVALVLVSWMWPAKTARMFIIKYKDAEFVQAARTLGASNSRIIFSHLVPNISGKLLVRLVNLIPTIIFFEASLTFLGLKPSDDISLGALIETSRLNDYWFLMGLPTGILILITLSAQIIANNLNDALDPKVSGA